MSSTFPGWRGCRRCAHSPETLQILMTATTADQGFNALSKAEQTLGEFQGPEFRK